MHSRFAFRPEGSDAGIPEICDDHISHQVGIGLLAGDAKGAGLEDLVQALLAHGRAVQPREQPAVCWLQELPPVTQESLELHRGLGDEASSVWQQDSVGRVSGTEFAVNYPGKYLAAQDSASAGGFHKGGHLWVDVWRDDHGWALPIHPARLVVTRLVLYYPLSALLKQRPVHFQLTQRALTVCVHSSSLAKCAQRANKQWLHFPTWKGAASKSCQNCSRGYIQQHEAALLTF